MFSRHLFAAILISGAVCGSAEPAAAQFRTSAGVAPYYYGFAPTFIPPPPGYSPYGAFSDPYGGYLSGAASSISSTGQFLVDSQSAYLIQQQTTSSALDNRRKAFDEWLYERANMPTLNDERKRIQTQEVERARNQPPPTEVWSGKSLNDLLASIQQAQTQGYSSGTDVPLRSETLKQINVTATGQGNAGLLKNVDRLRWPVGLQMLPQEKEAKELREQIGKLLSTATDQAARDELHGPTIAQLTKSVQQLRGQLLANVSEMSFVDYTAAKRYLASIDDAIMVLKSPQASRFVNGSLAAKGKTVKELVQYMTDNGLRFAPALSGEEEAYNAIYNAMLTYDVQTAALKTTDDSSSPSSK